MKSPTENLLASIILNKLHQTQPDLRQKIEDARHQQSQPKQEAPAPQSRNGATWTVATPS